MKGISLIVVAGLLLAGFASAELRIRSRTTTTEAPIDTSTGSGYEISTDFADTILEMNEPKHMHESTDYADTVLEMHQPKRMQQSEEFSSDYADTVLEMHQPKRMQQSEESQKKSHKSWFYHLFGLSSVSSSEEESSRSSESQERWGMHKNKENRRHYKNLKSVGPSIVNMQKVVKMPSNPRKVCVTIQPVPVCAKGHYQQKSSQKQTPVMCQQFSSKGVAEGEMMKIQKRIQEGQQIKWRVNDRPSIRVEQAISCEPKCDGSDEKQKELDREMSIFKFEQAVKHRNGTKNPNLTRGFFGGQCPPDVAKAAGVTLSCAADCIAAHNRLGGQCGEGQDYNCYCNEKIFEKVQLFPILRQNCPVQCFDLKHKEKYDKLCHDDCLCNHGALTASCDYELKACNCIGRRPLDHPNECPYKTTGEMTAELNKLGLPNVEFGVPLANGTIIPPSGILHCTNWLKNLKLNVTGL